MHIHFFLKFDMRRKLSDSNVVPDGSQRRMGGLFANWGTSSFQPGDPALIGNMLTHGSVKMMRMRRMRMVRIRMIMMRIRMIMMMMMRRRIKRKLWRWSTNDLRLPYASLLLMIFLHKVHLLPSPSSTKGGRMMMSNNIVLVEMMINCPSLRIGFKYLSCSFINFSWVWESWWWRFFCQNWMQMSPGYGESPGELVQTLVSRPARTWWWWWSFSVDQFYFFHFFI